MSSVQITSKEAYKILKLPPGADRDSIKSSYKRLAQKWFPERHKNSIEALNNFRKIALAFKCLYSSIDPCTITLEETFDIYKATFVPTTKITSKLKNGYSNVSSDSEDLSSSDADCDDDYTQEFVINERFIILERNSLKSKNKRDLCNEEEEECNPLSLEEREQVANELITEEEKKKKKLEKRRAKKKQRREKKRLEKQHVPEEVKQPNGTNGTAIKNSSNGITVSNGSSGSVPVMEHCKQRNGEKNNSGRLEDKSKSEQSQVNGQTNDADFHLSRRFAIEGNHLAAACNYDEAVGYFTKAIGLSPSEFRYFGNRSYCYEKMHEFEKALADADHAISLAPEWPKGHYRRAIALSNLKQYTPAEESFKQVLRLDIKCDDARKELFNIYVIQLVDMGFSQPIAEQAMSRCETLQQALDLLLSGLGNVREFFWDSVVGTLVSLEDRPSNGESNGVGIFSGPVSEAAVTTPPGRDVNGAIQNGETTASSKNDIKKATESSGKQNSQPEIVTEKKSKKNKNGPLLPIPQHHYEESQRNIQLNQQLNEDIKMNPRNPEGLKSIWVGNVLPDVDQEEFKEMFAKFGNLQGVRFMPDKFCAFINFCDKESASEAMHHLQGKSCNGQSILIKFPDHPIAEASVKMDKKEFVPIPTAKASAAASSKTAASGKQRATKESGNVKPEKSSSGAKVTASTSEAKITGPVNGNECYFWRTTGCQFSDNCRFLHITEHKGIDKKPWHKLK